MSSLTIEKNVPLPPKAGKQTKYGWEKMEVGDSLFFDANKHDLESIKGTAYCWGKNNGAKFTTRLNREAPYGVRIWRIE